jgi:uroporphyrinogen decarboxylase
LEPRERVFAAIEGEPVDRVPIDLGSSRVTSISRDAYLRMIEYLDLPIREKDVVVIDHMLQLPVLDERFLQALGVDVRGVKINTVRKDPELIEQERYWEYFDEYGGRWRKPKRGGLYFDLVESPLAGSIDESDIDGFAWPDWTSQKVFEGLKETAKTFSDAGYAVVLEGEGGGIFETASRVRGYTDLYIDLAIRPQLARKLFDRIADLRCDLWSAAAEELGEYVHIVREGDDIAGQDKSLFAPSTYRELLRPNHERVFRTIKEAFPKPVCVFFHSDGAIRELIPDFVEIGIDILNPVQPGLPQMDLIEIAGEYGDRIAFWGGGVDPQTALPVASPEEIRSEIRGRVGALLGVTTRYVFSSIHNVLGDVPPENVIAQLEGLHEAQALRFEVQR